MVRRSFVSQCPVGDEKLIFREIRQRTAASAGDDLPYAVADQPVHQLCGGCGTDGSLTETNGFAMMFDGVDRVVFCRRFKGTENNRAMCSGIVVDMLPEKGEYRLFWKVQIEVFVGRHQDGRGIRVKFQKRNFVFDNHDSFSFPKFNSILCITGFIPIFL